MKMSSYLIMLAVLGASAVANATPVTFTFLENGSDVSLGSTSTFTESGIGLTAYASPGQSLYAKNDGPGETGLGITSDSDHEINTGNFVQLNLTTTPASTFSLLFASSVQAGETANVYYSAVQGVLGTFLGTVFIPSGVTGSFDISGHSSGYIGVQAGSGNVLIASVTVNQAPDGASTVMLLGGALMGLGLIRRKLAA